VNVDRLEGRPVIIKFNILLSRASSSPISVKLRKLDILARRALSRHQDVRFVEVPQISKFAKAENHRDLPSRTIPVKEPETLHLAGISRQTIPVKEPETLLLAGISRQRRAPQRPIEPKNTGKTTGKVPSCRYLAQKCQQNHTNCP